MNVYQKILVKLFEVTGGKDSKSVDLKELTKAEGFYPSYNDIFKHLSHQGWITETRRSGVVRITHWGVKEAKRSQSGGDDGGRQTQKAANILKAEVKELLVMTEEFCGDISEDKFKQIEEKFNVVQNALSKLKANY
jgi:hypothetical protein